MRNNKPMLVLLGAVSVCLAVHAAQAQVRQAMRVNGRVVIVNGPVPMAFNAAPPNAVSAFQPPAPNQQATDLIATFRDHAAGLRWEKAFRALEDLDAIKPAPMIATAEGFVLPLSEYRRSLLVSLPVEGRRAFGVFYEPQVKALLARAEAGGPDEIKALAEVYDRYFVAASAATAADRLGDARFEAGDFLGAAECWGAVLDDHADADVSALRLRVKRAAALARAGNAAELESERHEIEQRFAGQSVTIGGREVDPSVLLASATPPPAPAAVAAPRPLPTQPRPAWTFTFLDDPTRQAIMASLRQRGWNMQFNGLTPAVDADDQRVYFNWMGMSAAIDAATGKPAWQTGDLRNAANVLPNLIGYGSMDQFSIVRDGDVMLMLTVAPNGGPFTQVTRVDPASGQVKWTTASGDFGGAYMFVGKPLIVGGTIYATAINRSRSELALAAIDPATGAKRWEATLGTPPVNPNMGVAMCRPNLACDRGTLCVLTNDGALVAVDLVSQKLRWVYVYPVTGGPMIDPRSGMRTPGRAGGIVVRDGVAYFRDGRSDKLRALRLADRQPLWETDMEGYAPGGVIGADEQMLYLLGDELAGYSRQDGTKRWWSNHFGSPASGGGSGASPLLEGGRFYICGPNGLFQIDAQGGKVTGMLRDIDAGSGGGPVIRSGNRLIIVTDTAINAYPLPAPVDSGGGGAATQTSIPSTPAPTH